MQKQNNANPDKLGSAKIRVLRKHKNYVRGQRFWESKGWYYSHGNLLYPFPRWIKRIQGQLIWAICIEDTSTSKYWQFHRG